MAACSLPPPVHPVESPRCGDSLFLPMSQSGTRMINGVLADGIVTGGLGGGMAARGRW